MMKNDDAELKSRPGEYITLGALVCSQCQDVRTIYEAALMVRINVHGADAPDVGSCLKG
jgi:uncharacterized UBP type Zn finger protein